MLKVLAILFGLAFLAAGILGFLPEFTQYNRLFGYFLVNPMHNWFHLATGIVSLLCGISGSVASKVFFIIFGLIYTAVAVLGFIQGEGMLLNLIAINKADNWLHAVIAVVSLYFGIFLRSE